MVINFTYQSPTKVIFGKDAENSVGDEIKALGFKKVLVHFGGTSAVKSGLLDRVFASLDAAGIAHLSLGGVQPNPRLSLARKGIELGKKEGVDFILAVGGGSVIDSAKCIGYGMACSFDVWEIFSGARQMEGCIPLGSVLTIAAAGSETSNSCVITNDETNDKWAFNHDIARPRFAVMNPELTYSLPEYQTMSGVVDIIMHTLERYITNDSGDLVDRMSEGLMVSVMEMGPKLKANPRDYDARAEIMWAGSLSHNGLTGTGRTGDWACHQLEHELSGMFDVAHGAGLSAVWGSWARYVYKHDVARFAQFAVRVMGCRMNFFTPDETALEGIAALEDFFQGIGMPTSISELGVRNITEEQMQIMVEKCSRQGKRRIGNFVQLDEQDMRKIFENAR